MKRVLSGKFGCSVLSCLDTQMPSLVEPRKLEIHFSDLEKDAIVAECVSATKWKSVKAVAKSNNITRSLLRSWVKEAGLALQINQIKEHAINQCRDAKISPAKLAQSADCHRSTIQRLVKKNGVGLPRKYEQHLESASPKPKADALSMEIFTCTREECNFTTQTKWALEIHISSKL